MIQAFLLAMQAAGLVMSYAGARSQYKMIEMGRSLEEAQFKTNMEALKTQSADQSLQQLKQLRKNIASQIVQSAASGNRANTGTIDESFRNFNNDERMRRMNLLGKESELRANNILSGLHTLQSETELGQKLTSGALDTFSSMSTASIWDKKPEENTKGFNWGIAGFTK